jgi:hypothetical protein
MRVIFVERDVWAPVATGTTVLLLWIMVQVQDLLDLTGTQEISVMLAASKSDIATYWPVPTSVNSGDALSLFTPMKMILVLEDTMTVRLQDTVEHVSPVPL